MHALLPETALPQPLASAAVSADSTVRPAPWLWSHSHAPRPLTAQHLGEPKARVKLDAPSHSHTRPRCRHARASPLVATALVRQLSAMSPDRKISFTSSPPGRQAPLSGPRALPATGGQAASRQDCALDGRWEGPVLPSPAPTAPHCGLPWLSRDLGLLALTGAAAPAHLWHLLHAPPPPPALGPVCTQASPGQPLPLEAALPHGCPGSVPATECARTGCGCGPQTCRPHPVISRQGFPLRTRAQTWILGQRLLAGSQLPPPRLVLCQGPAARFPTAPGHSVHLPRCAGSAGPWVGGSVSAGGALSLSLLSQGFPCTTGSSAWDACRWAESSL